MLCAAHELLTPEACGALREAIARAGGVEVFAIGTAGAGGLVESIEARAFGNAEMVPAPAQGTAAGQVLIHNHPDGPLEPSDADLAIASDTGARGLGFYIVDNDVTQVRVVVRPFTATEEVPLDTDALLDEFRPGGALARGIPGYEERPQQEAMMRAAAEAFNRREVAVIEAGTGTGKSFAYLAPAFRWAPANKRKVVVATHTINLQEQLLRKDIPALAAALGVPVRAALVKGRSNFLSLRRLPHASASAATLLTQDRGAELAQLTAWSNNTQEGSRSELPFAVSPDVWDSVMSDKDDCLRARCPHFSECFFYRNRREAAAADIVVANHHIVMADVAVASQTGGADFSAILPPFDRLVVDEAHHLEDVATNYFSSETSPRAIQRQLARLLSSRGDRGSLIALRSAIFEADPSSNHAPTAPILDALSADLQSARSELDLRLSVAFQDLFQQASEYFGAPPIRGNERRELRITPTVAESGFFTDARETLAACAQQLTAFLAPLEKALGLARQYPEALRERLVNALLGAAAGVSKLKDHAGALKQFTSPLTEAECRWLELTMPRGEQLVRLCAAPLDVAPGLRTYLFERKATVLLTSATLTVGGKFDFFAKRWGLAERVDVRGGAPPAVPEADGAEVGSDTSDEDSDAAPARPAGPAFAPLAVRTQTLRLDSPFDFARQCLVAIARDMPAPDDPQFDARAIALLESVLTAAGGRAFVLFTSHGQLGRFHDNLAPRLAAANLHALRQGEMPRDRLLAEFRSLPRAVLFGTSSFWEGVDVAGDALQLVVLVKLPFMVPSTPILEARTEAIERAGGNAFRELQIPQAVIRFKQGFGRLIRTKTDRGVVLILDSRVVTKFYGRTFLASLPPARVEQLDIEKVPAAVENFFAANP